MSFFSSSNWNPDLTFNKNVYWLQLLMEEKGTRAESEGWIRGSLHIAQNNDNGS